MKKPNNHGKMPKPNPQMQLAQSHQFFSQIHRQLQGIHQMQSMISDYTNVLTRIVSDQVEQKPLWMNKDSKLDLEKYVTTFQVCRLVFSFISNCASGNIMIKGA